MKTRLYLKDTTTAMLTKALKLDADQKQMKNLHNYFGGDVTICMYPLPPVSLERNHEKENKIKKIKKLCVIKETCHETRKKRVILIIE